MIGKLTGVFAGMMGSGEALIDVGGVGYAVRVTLEMGVHLAKNPAPTVLFIHTAVRDDAIDLYGFESDDELSFFRLLLSVSGVGPKTALQILNLAPLNALRGAVASGDATYLTKVSGIGKKSAARIVVELKDKLAKEGHARIVQEGDGDVIDALLSLGYRVEEAREAMKKIGNGTTETKERLREALKILGS